MSFMQSPVPTACCSKRFISWYFSRMPGANTKHKACQGTVSGCDRRQSDTEARTEGGGAPVPGSKAALPITRRINSDRYAFEQKARSLFLNYRDGNADERRPAAS